MLEEESVEVSGPAARRLALALPQAHEDAHRGKPAFRVNTRILAMAGVARPGAAPKPTDALRSL
jgi:hypothetical protein